MPNESRIFSSLANDPVLGDLVAMYVDEMPERVEQLRATIHDKEELLRQIHQLKGAAGSYGFKELSIFAGECDARIEAADEISEIQSCLEVFISHCLRATSEPSP